MISYIFTLLLFISSVSALTSDGILLLAFKYSLLSDPLSVLDNWNYDDPNPCSWNGVTCEPLSGIVISLVLPDSHLLGSIPEDLGVIPHLQSLDLSNNSLNGSLPDSIFNSSELETISLSSNFISGDLPEMVTGLQSLKMLNLSNNRLSGSVSPEFAGKIPVNAVVDLSFNNLTGEIPEVLSLSRQKTEFFAGNEDMCGKPLKKICTVNATSNGSATATATAAIAAIPRNIDPSPSSPTTSGPPDRHGHVKVKPAKIAAIVAGDLAGIGLLAILFLYGYNARKKKMHQNKNQNQNQNPTIKNQDVKISKDVTTCSCLNGDESSETDSNDEEKNNDMIIDVKGGEKCLVMVDGETELEMETLLKASAYVLGSSGSSIVYKAVLGGGGGMAFAVRRIGESGVGVESMSEFEKTVRMISKVRHRNLLRVRGFYWAEDEKLVIYDYVSNGSLAAAGYTYRKVGSSPCNIPFEVRLKIAKGVAMGLAYIHEKKHVHGNIKPSNILLTSEMDPIISDFGLEWLISGKHNHRAKGSNRHFGSKRSREEIIIHHDYHNHHSANSSPYMAPASGLLGCTSPYHAPESMKSLKPSPRWDVYSFGIVLLELISGKVFSERELGQWYADSSTIEDERSILQLAGMSIGVDHDRVRVDAILAYFKLGFTCASLNPQKRPSMKEALQILEKIQFTSSIINYAT